MAERLHTEIDLNGRGRLIVDENADPEYPGVSIILIPADDPDQTGEDNRYRVDVEWADHLKLPRVYIWNDPNLEDPSIIEGMHPDYLGGA